MGVRKPPRPTILPSALICALFEDKGRYFFLEKTDERARRQIELPCVLVNEGEDPVAMLAVYLHSSLSLDAQIHLICLRGMHNSGSRKRKHLIPALAFRCTAKRMNARLPSSFSGSRWLSAEDALKERLGRNTDWLQRAEKI